MVVHLAILIFLHHVQSGAMVDLFAIDQARQAFLYDFNIDIPQLAMVKVDQERVDDGAQCTICLETFNLDEDVAKLDCQVSYF
jgi:hypothetical protein